MTIDTDAQAAERLKVASTRDRLLDAAQHVVETDGWSAITMSRIATISQVSRQTVHNELGTRSALAQALALRELERFLDLVRTRMRAESVLEDAVEAACEGALSMAANSRLVRIIVGSTSTRADSDLLATLTTDSGDLVDIAAGVVKDELTEQFPQQPFDSDELDVLADTVVRVVLSAVTRPSKPPADMARDVAWIVQMALAGRRAQGG